MALIILKQILLSLTYLTTLESLNAYKLQKQNI